MPPKIRSAYGGGYSESIKQRLEKIVIPEKVKCVACKVIQTQSAFSKRQLDDLRHAIYTDNINPTTTGMVKCRNCVGNQILEMRCSVCDEVKGLDEFARNQRHNKDVARCLVCVQAHRDADPLGEEQKLLLDCEYSTLNSTTVTLSQLDARSSLASRSGDSEDGGISLLRDGWVERDTARWSSARGREDHNLSRPSPSVFSQKKNSNFAKVPAYVSQTKPLVQPPVISKKTVPCDDEDEEDIEDFL
ncbi:hypothetical protein FE257_002537 [Aspergillus nanangensis]|uniref:Stc1 domain-containing protein n=1 Tax=Aspergillus nanangensis TaxID=2582783 RepID=A0AAD4CT78_ASPNN|nr:hypothetical protein FE257_002537 [Aspergillus nanangensis]